MKPPHHLCLSCGKIITDVKNPPHECPFCGRRGSYLWRYLGYRGEYTKEEVQEIYDQEKIIFDLEELSTGDVNWQHKPKLS